MNDRQDSNPVANYDDSLGRVIRAAGRRQSLPPSTRQRWQAVFAEELQNVVVRRRQQRWLAGGAVCAALLVALIVIWPNPAPQVPAVVARIVEQVGISQATVGEGESQSTTGLKDLPVNSTLQTGNGAYLSLAYRGASVRLNQHSRVRLLPDRIELVAGELYVDSEAVDHGYGKGFGMGSGRGPSVDGVTISTRLAEITHLGTQFRVAVDYQGVTSAVRSGGIVIRTGGREIQAEALPGTARQLKIDVSGEIAARDVPASGEQWDWIMAVSQDFDIDGHTVLAFLHWVASETGVSLQFAGEEALADARGTVLHGDISALNPDAAIDPVLATTDLVAERMGPGVLSIRQR